MEALTCRMCEVRGQSTASEASVATAVLAKMLGETEEKIRQSQARQVELERARQELVTRAEVLEERRQVAMGPMEKKLDQVLTTEVRAFRQTFGSHQLTGHGISKVLERRDLLVAVFAGTKWARIYFHFLENMAVFHHLAMSQRPLNAERMDALKTAVRNLSIVMVEFQCRLTPKMDVLFMIVVPFAERWGCLGIFREEKIESLHAKVNITNRVLACIRRLEVRMFVSFQREELKELHRLIGQVVKRGPRSPQEVAKRKERKEAGQVGARMLEFQKETGLEAATLQEIGQEDI